MTENEVNLICKEWLINNGYHYKGILNTRPNPKANVTGYGQVPVPDGERQVLIDHQGVNNIEKQLIWIEAKGSGVGMSQLLEGFTRVGYACWCGGGKGLLAIPNNEYQQLTSCLPLNYLKAITKASERRIGLLNTEDNKLLWLI